MGRKVFVFIGIFLVFALPGLVFFLRAPVLVVTDASFVSLYGARRAQIKRVTASIRLFRRVKPVLIAESAGADVFVVAVEAAAVSPYCVIFPPRYDEGGRRYAEQFPDVPVISLGGDPEEAEPGPGRLIYAGIRREEDFYRAGQCAGILAARASETEDPGPPGDILVLPGQNLPAADKNAFSAGLRTQGIETAPLFLYSAAGAVGLAEASCVIVVGPAGDYLEKNLTVPVILFSWLDPALTSRQTVMVFDDSPWALIVPAVKLAIRGETGAVVPSIPVFPQGRIADKELLRNIKRVVRNGLP